MSQSDPRTDAQLLADSGQDAEAFGIIYDRHVRAMLGYFYRRTLCAEMAADLASETFAAAFLQRRKYRDTGAPTRAWLVGIGRRQLANALRRQQVETRARERLGMNGSHSTTRTWPASRNWSTWSRCSRPCMTPCASCRPRSARP